VSYWPLPSRIVLIRRSRGRCSAPVTSPDARFHAIRAL
jgi:hypothetical protein